MASNIATPEDDNSAQTTDNENVIYAFEQTHEQRKYGLVEELLMGPIHEAELSHESCNDSDQSVKCRRYSQMEGCRKKRVHSNVDRVNLKNLKLNTSACLQKEFENRMKEIRDFHKNKDKNKKKNNDVPDLTNIRAAKGKYFNGHKVKQNKKEKKKANIYRSVSSQSECAKENNSVAFNGFDYSGNQAKSIQKQIEESTKQQELTQEWMHQSAPKKNQVSSLYAQTDEQLVCQTNR